MKILLIGSGGREHALAWAISASPLCDRLFIAPGNPGTAHCGENVVVDVADHAAVVAFCRLQGIDLVVKIEIEAVDTNGFDENKIRTLSENAKTLKFDQSGFEDS